MIRRIAIRVLNFPLLPFLAAVIVPLQLLQANPLMLSGGAGLMRIMLVGAATALLTTLVLWLALRNVHRAGILAMILVGLIAVGRPPLMVAARFLEDSLDISVPPSALLLGIFTVMALLLRRLTIPAAVTHGGNAVTWAILMYNAIMISLAAPERFEPRNNPEISSPTATRQHFLEARASQERSDIIHIVLDGYSRADALADIYGVDNTKFLASLEDLGFKVASGAVAPYNQTLLTITSIFRGDYLPSRTADDMASAEAYRTGIAAAFRSNPVMTALRKMDYRIATTKSEFPPLVLEGTVMSAPSQGVSMTHLERLFFELSSFSLIVEDLGMLGKVTSSSASEIRSALAASLREQGDRPYFHFIHLLAPHPPFDVDSRGRVTTRAGIYYRLADGSHFHQGDPDRQKAYREGYRQKLAFINDEILDFLKAAINQRRGPLIILLHGDHGGGLHLDQEDISATCARERYLPLLAIYSSDGLLQQAVDPNTNLVNIYRAVFNSYFATEFAMLPSRSSFAPSSDPARHIPVPAERLAGACTAPD